MKSIDAAVMRAEQQMLGYTVIFTNRWDHRLALEALKGERDRFERWARKELEDRKTTDPPPRLVSRYLNRYTMPTAQMTEEQKATYYRGCAFIRLMMHEYEKRELVRIKAMKLTPRQLHMLRETSRRNGLYVTSKDPALTLLVGWALVSVKYKHSWRNAEGAYTITSVGRKWLEHFKVKPHFTPEKYPHDAPVSTLKSYRAAAEEAVAL